MRHRAVSTFCFLSIATLTLTGTTIPVPTPRPLPAFEIPPAPAYVPPSTRVSFTIAFQEVTSNLSLISSVTMPGAITRFETTATATASQGTLKKVAGGWEWRAPNTPGLTTLAFDQNGETATLQMFGLTPWKNGQGTSLNGFKIGQYSPQPYRGLRTYEAPTGFIELTEEVHDLKISPHFTLGQFKCKQQSGAKPSYLLIHPGTLLKLERLLEAANAKGWKADTFTVMSGFRTPHYNRSIGNTTTSSRHLFGGAADIFIDADGDGMMDDLNGDGKLNKEDANVLAALAESLADENSSGWADGGLAPYSANAAHGPFIHIDVRGYRARWNR